MGDDILLFMDASKFVTKADLKKESKAIRAEMLRLEERIEKLEEEVKGLKEEMKELRKELNELRAEFREISQRLDVKLDRLQNTMDKFVGRVDDLTVENEVGAHHTRELTVKVGNLEKRVKRLESSKQVE